MKLENIFKQIKSDSIEGHEKELQYKILGIELKYIDNLFQKKIKPLYKDSNVDSIHDLVSKYTDIPSKIMEYENENNSKEDLLAIKEKILNNISDLYSKDYEHWIEKTEELIELVVGELEKYKNQFKKENFDNSDFNNKAGLIDFGVETDFGHLLPESGISEEDSCLQIHFESFFKQQKKDVKNLFSSNSLEKLAIKIIDEYPEIKAVVAQSWLMDTPIAKRIGFTIFDRDFDIGGGGTFWGQFIDSNGQIKNDEVSKFLKTGKPKYRTCAGAIMVEDFLKKYLPEDRRGKILLKKVRPGIEGFNEKIKKEGKIFENIITNLNKMNEEEIKNKIFECEIFGNFSKSKEGDGLIETIMEFKRNGKSVEAIKNGKLLLKYTELFQEYLKKLKFVDREVVI